jgi:catechol 2,3-dioxygenase-like lactoylglutathione lyase family enzyme
MRIEMISLTVEDMGRAVNFYSELLGERPVKNMERLSIFDLATSS